MAQSPLTESQLKWVSCEMYLVCPFNSKLCNSTLLITEHQPARASLCHSSPGAVKGPSCPRCCYSVLGGGTGLGTELPGGSTCADTKSSSWAVFPAELASGRRDMAAAAHLTPEAVQPDLSHQMCWPRSPREFLVSRAQVALMYCQSLRPPVQCPMLSGLMLSFLSLTGILIC